MPWPPRITAVLTPTTCEVLVTSGPPELPGLSAASVWIRFSSRRTVRARSERPSALTTPAVTVCWKPNGLPIAITSWPGRKRGRIAERRRDQIRRGDAQHGEIRVRIVTDEVRHEIPTVRQRHADRFAPCDDVTVGENQAVGREDESRAGAAGVHLHDGRTDHVDGRHHRANTRHDSVTVDINSLRTSSGLVVWIRCR